ncbi:MAG TPA: exodeoxyribonuclease VII small subunit [Pirellulaceae bacterium]|nr:exodeoxyribonuclease VII small subunit [Pirellulaceae bacterium]
MAKERGAHEPTGSEADAGLSFEAAYSELEEIVRRLESSQLGLSQSLELYEQGIARLKVCQRVLAQAERKIELLTAVGSNGEARTETFDDDASSPEAKVGRRAPRKAPRKDPGGDDSSGPETGTMDGGATLF